MFGFGALVMAGIEEWGLIHVDIPGIANVVQALGRDHNLPDVGDTVRKHTAAESTRRDYRGGADGRRGRPAANTKRGSKGSHHDR